MPDNVVAEEKKGAEKIKVFISYSRQDSHFAEALRDALLARDVEAYVDKHDILPGEPWRERLSGLITAAETVVFCLSPAWVKSDMCAWEVNEAERLGKRLLPAVAADVPDNPDKPDEEVPGRLKRLNYIFMRDLAGAAHEFAEGVDKLIAALNTDIAWHREHTRLTSLLSRWETAERAEQRLLSEHDLRALGTLLEGRPRDALEPSDSLLAFRDLSREQLDRERDKQRRIIGRGFVEPAKRAWEIGCGLTSLQRVAAGAVLAEDPSFELVPELSANLSMVVQSSHLYPLNIYIHEEPVQTVVFSPSGTLVATATCDNSARLWDAVTGEELPHLEHNGEVNALAFSPDGARLATASDDGTAHLWDTANGAELACLRHDAEVRAVAFSPDGTRLATASEDKTARLWDVASGTELSRLEHDGSVWAVDFSPDGARLATGSLDDAARLWDTALDTQTYLEHNGRVLAVAFSPNGCQVATASNDIARLWGVASGSELFRLEHDDRVRAVAFSPDSTRLATVSDDTARLWGVASGSELFRLEHDAPVVALVFSPDGARLATASDDGTAHLWDTANGAELACLRHDAEVRAVAFSPDGTRLATASEDKTARLWDAANGAELSRIIHEGEFLELNVEGVRIQCSHGGEIRAFDFSPDGSLIATASKDKTTRLWKVERCAKLRGLRHRYEGDDATISADSVCFTKDSISAVAPMYDETANAIPMACLRYVDEVNALAFSPDGARLATASDDGTAHLWDTANGAELACLRHDAEVRAVAFSPDGTRLATASEDKTARLWDAANGAELSRLEHDDSVTAVAFSPDGGRLATASWDWTARLWDVASGTELFSLKHDGSVWAVVFSPDVPLLATVSDSTARLWDVANGAELFRLEHNDSVTAVVFSPDGGRLATGSVDKAARLWDVANGTELSRIEHNDSVTAVAFSPDGAYFATASGGRSVRLWDVSAGSELARLNHEHHIKAVHFGPNGARVATVSDDGTAHLWDISRLQAFAGDKPLYLAAALANGCGRKLPVDRNDLLMQDAPDDLYSALLHRILRKAGHDMPETAPKDEIEAAFQKHLPDKWASLQRSIKILRQPLDPRAYLTPSQKGWVNAPTTASEGKLDDKQTNKQQSEQSAEAPVVAQCGDDDDATTSTAFRVETKPVTLEELAGQQFVKLHAGIPIFRLADGRYHVVSNFAVATLDEAEAAAEAEAALRKGGQQ